MRGKWFRLISIGIVFALLICSVGSGWQGEGSLCRSASAEMEYEGDLEMGVLQEVYFNPQDPERQREAIYRFIPGETDTYEFYSISDFATAAYLYNSSGTRVDSDITRKGQRENFSLKCELLAGKTYYFGAQFSSSSSQIGSFKIGIRKTLRLSMFENIQDITGVTVATGIEQKIPSSGAAVYARFQPGETGYYNIYSKDFCGCRMDCQEDCICWKDGQCGCLNNLKATVYIQNKEGELESLYCNTASEKANGFLIRDEFQKGQTYYLVIMAADETQTGSFKLAVGKDLSEVPMEQLEWGKKKNLIIENNQENLFYKVIPDKDGTYRFTSEMGVNLYAVLYDKSMTPIMQSNELEDNFKKDVVLHGGQEYYLKLSTLFEQTFWFYLTGSYVSPDMTPPGGGTEGGDGSGGTGGGGIDIGQNKKISIANLEMEKIPNQAYTGKKIKPSVKMKYKGTLLVQGKDYSLAYKNNKNIGSAIVTIQGIGNYSGTRNVKFSIVPKKVKLKTAKRSGKKISMKWKKVAKVTGYEVSYSYSRKFKGAKKKTTKKTSLSIKLTKKKTCYVRVRAYKKVKKKKFYGSWSKVKKLKV